MKLNLPIRLLKSSSACPEYQFEEDEITNFVDENVEQLLKPSQEVIAQPINEPYRREPSPKKSPMKVSELGIGNQRYQISKQKQILEILANWLIDQGKLKHDSVPESVRGFLNENGKKTLRERLLCSCKIKKRTIS